MFIFLNSITQRLDIIYISKLEISSGVLKER